MGSRNRQSPATGEPATARRSPLRPTRFGAAPRRLALLAALTLLTAVAVSSSAGAASSRMHASSMVVTAQDAASPGGDPSGTGAVLVRWAADADAQVSSYVVTVRDQHGREVAQQSCTAACTSALLGDVPNGSGYRVSVTPMTHRAGRPGTSASLTVGTLTPPEAPTAASATEVPGTDQLSVTWTPATTGDAAEWYYALVWDVTDTSPVYLGARKCGVFCTSTVIDSLTPGHHYTVAVVGANDAGTGVFTTAATGVAIDTGCAADACLTADATAPTGAETRPGQGFLHGVAWNSDLQLIDTLNPSWWRLNTGSVAAPVYRTFDVARGAGAKIVNVLSDDWRIATLSSVGYAEAPWTNGWQDYRAFVTAKVRADIAAGRSPDVWEVQNEPGAPGYLSPWDTAQFTVARQLQEFLVAYQAIRSVDPTAKVGGPAQGGYATQLGTYPTSPKRVDLTTFLQFCQDNHIQLGALTWHDSPDPGGALDIDGQPINVAQHIATAKALLARYDVGHPLVLVTEYLGPVFHTIPGWSVGELSALEQAGADGAMRACWYNATDPAAKNDCQFGALDGLLVPDGSTVEPTALYGTYRTYANLTGQRVALRSSSTTISGVAATDGHGLRLLIGRHVGCNVPGAQGCTLGAPAATTTSTQLRLRLPAAGTYDVTVQVFHPGGAADPAPSTDIAPATVTTDSNGWVTLHLTGFGDGNARSIVLTPAG